MKKAIGIAALASMIFLTGMVGMAAARSSGPAASTTQSGWYCPWMSGQASAGQGGWRCPWGGGFRGGPGKWRGGNCGCRAVSSGAIGGP